MNTAWTSSFFSFTTRLLSCVPIDVHHRRKTGAPRPLVIYEQYCTPYLYVHVSVMSVVRVRVFVSSSLVYVCTPRCVYVASVLFDVYLFGGTIFEFDQLIFRYTFGPCVWEGSHHLNRV